MAPKPNACDAACISAFIFWGCVAVIVAGILYIIVHPEVLTHG